MILALCNMQYVLLCNPGLCQSLQAAKECALVRLGIAEHVCGVQVLEWALKLLLNVAELKFIT